MPAVHSADEPDQLRARAARFAREARRPPPALPSSRISWTGGKIVTSGKDKALRKLLERKAHAGEPLTAEQARAAAEMGIGTAVAGGIISIADLANTSRAEGEGKAVQRRQQENSHRCNGHSRTGAANTRPVVKVDREERSALMEQRVVLATSQKMDQEREVRRLQKKLRECEELELKLTQGAVLEANQTAKIERKAEFTEQLRKLQAAVAAQSH